MSATDFNDLAAASGLEEVRRQIEQAEPARTVRSATARTTKGSPRVPRAAPRAQAADETHHDLANQWVRAHAIEGHTPVHVGGSFHLPGADGLWHSTPDQQVEISIARAFNGRKLCRKNSDYLSIRSHVAGLCHAPEFFEGLPPAVVTPQGLHRMGPGGGITTEPLTLEHRQTFALRWAPNFDAEAPMLDRLLSHAFVGHHEAEQTDLFWQLFGATLLGMLPAHQVVVLMLGRERSGKSVLQRVVEAAFPPDAVAAVPPSSWGHEYFAASLAPPKRVNLVGELSDDAPIPAAAFKNVTGLNLVQARHPTHRPFSFRCLASHWFASNVLPPTTDRSEAFYRRWRVLWFANTVPAEQVDHGLYDRIVRDEMPAVLAHAFRGAERVARSSAVRASPAHDQVLDRWRMAANPLQQFLTDAEWIELDPSCAGHGTPEVYEAYRRWSASCGFRNPFGRNHLLELLDATGATRGVLIKRVGTRTVVVGLRLLKRGSDAP